VKFASASFEEENRTQRLPGFGLFLTRIFLFDFFSIGILPITEALMFTIVYICLLRAGMHPVAGAATALALTEANLIVLCVAIKQLLIGRNWGADDVVPFWSWRHFAYFFAQDCFFVWCRGPLAFCAGTVLANSVLRCMGCRIGRRTILPRPMQCSDWNAVSFGHDCVVDGFLQLHTFENLMLKVKRARIEDGCAVNFGATVMAGAVIERETTLLPLSLVLKEMKLPTATYEGSPAGPASDASLRASLTGAAPSTSAPRPVDNTDWLKTAAIILACVDHFGHFFMENDQWWAVFGRLAAPIFFFLMGYAQTRTVPLHWIGLGVILTLLNSWNADWAWVTPNILLNLTLIRFARPYADSLVQHRGWVAFGLLVCALLALLPAAATIIDYGTEGWLWALFGLCQRRYVDARAGGQAGGGAQARSAPARTAVQSMPSMRLLACLVAAVVYVWQEQKEFSFPQIHLAVIIAGVGVLSLALCWFRRGASRIQPPQPIAGALRFIGRHTLEIYALQLAGSELIAGLLPDLAP
jgi:hypothetical protein